ncbi:MAG: TMEM175 family protein [Terricaulis sp.]
MSHHESAARGPDARMVDRMLFFSDAVFAIVLTLLVLELRAPEIEPFTEAALADALFGMAEHFAAFFITFALTGLWWSIHMRVTRRLQRFDWLSAIANLVFLLCIALTPFASAVFGGAPSSVVALEVYWGVNTAIALAMTTLFLVIHRGKGKLVGGLARGEWTFRLIQSLAPAIAFATSIYLAQIGQVQLSHFGWALMFPIMLFGRLFFRPSKAPPAT